MELCAESADGMAATRAQAQAMEGIVARLEQAIGRHCRVSRNEKLRNKNTGQLREFDVVVRPILPSREYIAVVEVQKRSRKVGVPTLEGWIAKAQGVGANRLVCVSERGFADTAKILAEKHGTFVDLYELTSFKGWPADLPKIDMQLRGAPVWTVGKVAVQGHAKAEESGGRFKRGDVVAGQLPLKEKPFLWEDARSVLGPMELLAIIAHGLHTNFPSVAAPGNTLDLALPGLPGQRLKIFTPHGLHEVSSVHLRVAVTAQSVPVDRVEVLQYRSLRDGKAAGYVVSPIVEAGMPTPFRIDLAVAPPEQGHLTSVVGPFHPRPPGAYPGDEFGVLCVLPPLPVLKANVRVYTSEPPAFEQPPLPIEAARE
jgi:hypothetical protein